jgi:hypothetical protein
VFRRVQLYFLFINKVVLLILNPQNRIRSVTVTLYNNITAGRNVKPMEKKTEYYSRSE